MTRAAFWLLYGATFTHTHNLLRAQTILSMSRSGLGLTRAAFWLRCKFHTHTHSHTHTHTHTHAQPTLRSNHPFHVSIRPRRTSTLPLTLTSAWPPTRAWEVARTVVAPPSSGVKCLWEVFVWGVVLVVCVCVSVSGVLFSVGVCVCDLLIFLQASG